MRMRPQTAFGLALFVAGPTSAAEPAPLADYVAARIQSDAVVEASGIACHEANEGRIWVLNDSGWPAEIYAVDQDGQDAGSMTIRAPNDDWEDMAVTRKGDATHIVIGDIGDNAGSREWVVLYRLDEDNGDVSSLRFTYPGGPRDAESVAIDDRDGMAYVLSKRTLPTRLYAVPTARWNDPEPVLAQDLGTVTTVPAPTFLDRFLAHARRSWHWQTTAMDISPDGSRIGILTYTAVYLFTRDAGMSFRDALDQAPMVFSLENVLGAESLCLTGSDVFVTTEGRQPALYRIPLNDPGWAPLFPAR